MLLEPEGIAARGRRVRLLIIFAWLSEVSGSIGYHQPPMGHMSNRERIARAAEEARLTAAEKAAKKATKKPTGSRAERAAKSVRMKVVWEVWNVAGTAVKSFPYPDKARAEAETEALTRSTGRTHILRPNKVPMD